MENFSKQQSFFDTDTIETIKEYSEVFEDPTFKCEITSLINFDEDNLGGNEKMRWINYEWKRIPEIYGGSRIKLLDNVSSLDVKQGSLGNCYLLSVCAVIAEYQNRLAQIFVVKELNRAGIYSVKFYVDGQVKKVTIDDRIPFDTYSNQPPFCKVSKTQHIWPILIEKAWAKHLGNYQNTIAGHPHELFKILTGAPSYYVHSEKYVTETQQSALWRKLQNCFLQNYYICAATPGATEGMNSEHARLIQEIKSIGLSTNHAYSCLFFFEFQASGKTMRLVKIRNPWGYLEQKKLEGEVITKNYYNIPEIRNNIGDVNQEGSFILTFEEFIKYFSSIYISNYHDNYELYSHKVFLNFSSKAKHFEILKVNLTYAANSKSKIFFSVNKPTKLTFSRKSSEDKHLYYSIFVGKLRNSSDLYDIEYVGHNEGFESTVTVELESFEKCEYIIFAHMDRHSGKVVDGDYLGYVSVYTSEESVFFEPVNERELDYEKLFDCYIYDYYRTFKISFSENLRLLSDDGMFVYNSFHLDNSNYGFVIFENLNHESLVNLSLSDITTDKDFERDHKGIINSKIKNRYEKTLNGQSFVLIPYYSTSIKYKYTYTFVRTREQLKQDLIKKGSSGTIRTSIGEMVYLKLKHGTGICFMFQNTLNDLIGLKFTLKENHNLICYDYVGSDEIDFYIPPYETFFLFFDLADTSQGFSLQYIITSNNIY